MKDITIYTYSFPEQKKEKSKPGFLSISLLCLLLFLADYASAQWTRKLDAHYDRGEMASVLYENKIYQFTGFGVWPNVEPTNEVYDPATDEWTLLASMPDGKAVTHQGLVLVGNAVWCIGGRLTDTQGPLTSEVWIYDITENTWSQGPQLTDPATKQPILWGGGGAALVGRTLHVFGGFINSPCDNDQDIYHLTLDVDKWLADPQQTVWENTRTPMPVKRNHISTTVFGGRIYVLGGQFGHDCGGGQDQRYSHMYDPLTDTWTRLTDLPTVRSHCEASIFPLDGKIYIAGGDGATDKITIFTPGANDGLGSWANAAFDLPINPFTNTNNYIGVSARVVGESLVVACGKIGNTDPRRETYTTPFARNIPYELGFAAKCFSKTLELEEKATVKNLLFTVEGQKDYTLTSDAAWLNITKNATGLAIQTAVDIEATMDATGLAPGTYSATVTASGTGAGPDFSEATFCVNMKVLAEGESQNTILVNAGGQAYSDSEGHTWEADTYFSGGTTSSKSFDVAGTVDDPLYLKYRFALASSSSTPGAPFSYNIPISEVSNYTITLHFVEPYFKKSGARKFDVSLEGQRVLSSYDLFAQHGFGRAVKLTFEGVPVTDGTLNILFSSVTNNAIVSGIKVEKTGSASTYTLAVNTTGSGSVTKAPNQDSYLSGTKVELTAAPASGYRFAGWSGDATGTANPVLVTMDKDKSVTAKFEEVLIESGRFVNAGGQVYSDSEGHTWEADTYFSGGTTSSKSFDVAGTVDDPLYLKYRFALALSSSTPGAPFSYDIPVGEADSYTLKLHFVEPYFKKSGARVFHVDVEGQRVLSNYDLFAQHGFGRAVVLTYEVASVMDGTLTILFTSVKNNAIVSAIELLNNISVTATASLKKQETGAQNMSLTIYPNANTGDKIFVEVSGFPDHEALNILIYDATGRKVQTAATSTDESGGVRVELLLGNNLQRGVYFVRVQGQSGWRQSRLVVQ